MPTGDGRRCDREVGSPARGWHSCNRPAKHTLSRYRAGIFSSLHACSRHLDAMLAENEGYTATEAPSGAPPTVEPSDE